MASVAASSGPSKFGGATAHEKKKKQTKLTYHKLGKKESQTIIKKRMTARINR